MAGLLSFKLAPGVRVSASSRGVRARLGPRAARVHVGGGRTGVSTGAGPFTAYQSTGSSARPRTIKAPSGLTPAQAERFHRAEAVRAEFARLDGLHRAEFTTVTREVASAPALPPFLKLYLTAEKQSLTGVSLWDRPARRAAKAAAHELAERWAGDLQVLAEQDRRARQDAIDAHWAGLEMNDPITVTRTLAGVFADQGRRVRVAGVHDADAGLLVSVPGLGIVPEQKPAVTPAGAPTLHKLSATERNEWYAQVVAAHLLLVAKEAFAHAAGLAAVRAIAVDGAGIPIVAARITRQGMRSASWRDRAWPVLFGMAPDLRCDVRGRTRELRTIDLRADECFGPLLLAE
jgi:hypothetical protein